MELKKDFIEKHGLSDEVVNELSTMYTTSLTETLGEKELEFETKYSGKANDNAEAILSGVAKSIGSAYGIERSDGEKITPYLQRVEQEYKKSLNSSKGKNSEEFLKMQRDLDTALQEAAKVEEFQGYKEKYETLNEQYDSLRVGSAFSDSKPKFSKDANEFEVDKKWGDVKNDIKANYNLEKVDGVWKAIDKENKHKIHNLSDVVSGYDSLKGLLKDRVQTGLGIQDGVQHKNMPFKLPKDYTMATAYTEIAKHLKSKGLSSHTDEYTVEFNKLREQAKANLAA